MSRGSGENDTTVDLNYEIETARNVSLQEMQDYIIPPLEVAVIDALLPFFFTGFEKCKINSNKKQSDSRRARILTHWRRLSGNIVGMSSLTADKLQEGEKRYWIFPTY